MDDDDMDSDAFDGVEALEELDADDLDDEFSLDAKRRRRSSGVRLFNLFSTRNCWRSSWEPDSCLVWATRRGRRGIEELRMKREHLSARTFLCCVFALLVGSPGVTQASSVDCDSTTIHYELESFERLEGNGEIAEESRLWAEHARLSLDARQVDVSRAPLSGDVLSIDIEPAP